MHHLRIQRFAAQKPRCVCREGAAGRSVMLGSCECSCVLQFGDSLLATQLPCPQVSRHPGCEGPWARELGSWSPGWFALSHVSLLTAPSALLRRRSWSLNTVLILETLKFSGLLMCLLVAENISPVCQFPQGSLLLIVLAPISLPILINLRQVKPQITCQINDWVSPALPWAFSKKGYQIPWVDYQSGLDYRGCMLCFFCHCE